MCTETLVMTMTKTTSVRGGSETQFPGKLHDMMSYVEQEGLEYIISWIQEGRAFMVHSPEKLLKILPKFFGQTKYRSFQRQLNMWHFERILDGPDKGAFSHPYFVRGNKPLCAYMSRHIFAKPPMQSSLLLNTTGISQSSPSINQYSHSLIQLINSRHQQSSPAKLCNANNSFPTRFPQHQTPSALKNKQFSLPVTCGSSTMDPLNVFKTDEQPIFFAGRHFHDIPAQGNTANNDSKRNPLMTPSEPSVTISLSKTPDQSFIDSLCEEPIAPEAIESLFHEEDQQGGDNTLMDSLRCFEHQDAIGALSL